MPDTLTEAEKTTLTREAGLGQPPSILTPIAVQFWAERRDDARYLADHGIKLVPPANGFAD